MLDVSESSDDKRERLNKLLIVMILFDNCSRNFHLPMLKVICEVLDLEKKGTKEEVADRVMTFCLRPKSTGKPVPVSKKRKSMIISNKQLKLGILYYWLTLELRVGKNHRFFFMGISWSIEVINFRPHVTLSPIFIIHSWTSKKNLTDSFTIIIFHMSYVF